MDRAGCQAATAKRRGNVHPAEALTALPVVRNPRFDFVIGRVMGFHSYPDFVTDSIAQPEHNVCPGMKTVLLAEAERAVAYMTLKREDLESGDWVGRHAEDVRYMAPLCSLAAIEYRNIIIE